MFAISCTVYALSRVIFWCRCFASREINTKTTLSWTHKWFATRVHTLFYIFCLCDLRLLSIILAIHWPLITCSCNVQCCRKVVMNTTQMNHWWFFFQNDSQWVYSGFSVGSWILLSDMNGQIFIAILHLNWFPTDTKFYLKSVTTILHHHQSWWWVDCSYAFVREPYLYRASDMSGRMRVVVKTLQWNLIRFTSLVLLANHSHVKTWHFHPWHFFKAKKTYSVAIYGLNSCGEILWHVVHVVQHILWNIGPQLVSQGNIIIIPFLKCISSIILIVIITKFITLLYLRDYTSVCQLLLPNINLILAMPPPPLVCLVMYNSLKTERRMLMPKSTAVQGAGCCRKFTATLTS